MLESNIQSSIINYAKKNDYIVLKTIKVNISGCSDIILFKNGKTIFVEVKSEKGIQSKLQKYFARTVESQGFKYYLVRSLEEFKKIIIEM